MDEWRRLIRKVVDLGIRHKEIGPKVESDQVATIVISTLEGALMLSLLYRDPLHLYRVQDSLFAYVETLRPIYESL
jgi:hypothetical protein